MKIVFDLVNVKYQIKYSAGVLCKQRSDQAKGLGEINTNNRGVPQRLGFKNQLMFPDVTV